MTEEERSSYIDQVRYPKQAMTIGKDISLIQRTKGERMEIINKWTAAKEGKDIASVWMGEECIILAQRGDSKERDRVYCEFVRLCDKHNATLADASNLSKVATTTATN